MQYDYGLAQSHPRYGRRLTTEVFDLLGSQGYAIVHDYLPRDQVIQMRAALEQAMPPWHERCEAPNLGKRSAEEAPGRGVRAIPSRDTCMFPYEQQSLNHAIVNDPEATSFAGRWLGTDKIHYRPGLGLASYPGFTTDDKGHIDNGNNSLLPPTPDDRRYSQLIFWFYLSDVDIDQGPTMFWPTALTEDGPQMLTKQPEAFVAAKGAVCLFTNYTFHAASSYTRPNGERYVWKHAWGCADFAWEGTSHYTMFGSSHALKDFVPAISPRQRELIRFPPLGHAYYTRTTLAALERQYPGFDRDGVYAAAATKVDGEEKYPFFNDTAKL